MRVRVRGMGGEASTADIPLLYGAHTCVWIHKVHRNGCYPQEIKARLERFTNVML